MRAKIKNETLTREQAEELAGQIAALKTEEARLKAEMDARIQDIRDYYAPDLAGVAEQVDALLPRLKAWADANPAAFGDKRSVDMTSAVVGYRVGNPTVRTLKGFDVETVKVLYPPFTRTLTELDKPAVLAAARTAPAGGGWTAEELRKLGLSVTQSETFYCEPKLSRTEPRETLAA